MGTQNQKKTKLEKGNSFSGLARRGRSSSQFCSRVRRLQSRKQLCQVPGHPSVPVVPRLPSTEAGDCEPAEVVLRAQHRQFCLTRAGFLSPVQKSKAAVPQPLCGLSRHSPSLFLCLALSGRPGQSPGCRAAPFPLNPLRVIALPAPGHELLLPAVWFLKSRTTLPPALRSPPTPASHPSPRI